MPYNLIRESWIPVRRRNGERERIAPWQITANHDGNPVIALDAPRPDFSGALIQFLIGLVQTVAPPKEEEAWFLLYENPPSPEPLQELFKRVEGAFNLDGDGPRFMQDFEPLAGKEHGIGKLLIETPGEETERENTDHFNKRGKIFGLCLPCTASALFTLQTNGPEGGRGILTGLRGGGPLSTVVLGDTLWETIWINVLEEQRFLGACGNPDKQGIADRFPWMAPTRTSERGLKTTPFDVHPAQLYWGMPRRIRLDTIGMGRGVCDVCGKEAEDRLGRFYTRPQGTDFYGAWRHPLTPIRRTAETVLPIHCRPGGISYRHWMGIVQEDKEEDREPALVVHVFHYDRQEYLPRKLFRLWAFGYDLKQMKARCWYESTMPLFHIPQSIRNEFEGHVAVLVKAANEIGKNTRWCLEKAWFKESKKPKKTRRDMSYVDAFFCQGTENDFFSALGSLREELGAGVDTIPVKVGWHKVLCGYSEWIFDLFAQSSPVGYGDPRRIALARRDLLRANKFGKTIRDLLGLPVETAQSRRQKKQRLPIS